MDNVFSLASVTVNNLQRSSGSFFSKNILAVPQFYNMQIPHFGFNKPLNCVCHLTVVFGAAQKLFFLMKIMLYDEK